jgi:hypothetical protein
LNGDLCRVSSRYHATFSNQDGGCPWTAQETAWSSHDNPTTAADDDSRALSSYGTSILMGLSSKETPMTTHPIPAAALDDRLGFLGMTGSGKTFGAGTCVKRILGDRQEQAYLKTLQAAE